MKYQVVTVAFTVLAMLAGAPVQAGNPEATAWTSIQKINEMAVEARNRCDAENCPEASVVAGTSFLILRHAKRCNSGRYPSSCRALNEMVGEIDDLYATYRAELGPEKVAENQARVGSMACQYVPMTGTCHGTQGLVQAQLTPGQP